MIFNLMRSVPDATPTEPTMYLYGHEATADETADVIIDGVGYVGAVLPKLPEWDKTTYPYAFMRYSNAIGTIIRFEVFEHRPFVVDGGYKFLDSGHSITHKYSETENIWEHGAEIEYDADSDYLFRPFWSNYDVLYEDGSIYLEATDPVPVYE